VIERVQQLVVRQAPVFRQQREEAIAAWIAGSDAGEAAGAAVCAQAPTAAEARATRAVVQRGRASLIIGS
jgi:hypothetical protein